MSQTKNIYGGASNLCTWLCFYYISLLCYVATSQLWCFQQWTGLCLCFMALRQHPVITVFARICFCVSSASDEGCRGSEAQWKIFLNLFRDDSVPQGSNWWVLGPPERGHKEGSEHPRWGRHDSHFTGCFPRTHRCPPTYMQQRVSLISSTSFWDDNCLKAEIIKCSGCQFMTFSETFYCL